MNDLDQLISTYGDPISLKTVVLSLLLAFGLTQAIAATYVWTFRGMSYSRGVCSGGRPRLDCCVHAHARN